MKIEAILAEHFGITVEAISKMEGYASINYKISTSERIFVLKQYPSDPQIKKDLYAEDLILEELQNLETYQFSRRINTLKGEAFAEVGPSIFRLLTYVKGQFLGEVEHTPALLHSLGQFLGCLDKKLNHFKSENIQARELKWDIKHLNKNKNFISSIPDHRDRSLVSYFFLQFNENIVPIQESFRKSLIYNDANDWNILTDGHKVTGTIDFGDVCHSWLVNEVAVAMTYVMMLKKDPLSHGKHVLQGYNKEVSLSLEECDALYYLIAARLCISVCNSAYTSKQKPDSTYITISEKGAWELLYQWIRINPIHAKNQFRIACGHPPIDNLRSESILNTRKKHFGKNLSLSYFEPIHMDGAAFQYMYDAKGKTFLDAYNNIMLVGHCHPKVVKAGQRAMAKLNTNTRYLFEALDNYTNALLEKFPAELNQICFVNSGSEASDLAIRMARQHTGKEKILVMEHGYHGNSTLGTQISSYKFRDKRGIGIPANILEVPLPKAESDKEQKSAAKHAKEIINEYKGEIACFITEPIIGCGGQVPLPKEYLKEVYPEIRRQGGVCISDEVQVGFGRLGEVFWGFELYDVIPDIVIIGKPMGNGHPIGAVITKEAIMTSFEKGPEFFSSFGGNPVSCAIGLAVLEVIQEEELQLHAKTTGNYLISGLQNLQKRHPVISDIRGFGLFLGVELILQNGNPGTELAYYVINELKDQGILVSLDGPENNVIKIKPPMTFNTNNCDEFISKLDTILSNFERII